MFHSVKFASLLVDLAKTLVRFTLDPLVWRTQRWQKYQKYWYYKYLGKYSEYLGIRNTYSNTHEYLARA
jgi:hypothetical protein